jgi:signal transduction histidine kinase
LEAVYDHGRLYNSLYNLVGNALPETPDGGSITLNVAPCAEDPLHYIVSVADTGRGMPEEVRAKLFTDASRSTKPGGTGLGTQIVRRTVEQHGGSVWVESVPGAGTTITLSLPIVPEAQSQPAIDFSSA